MSGIWRGEAKVEGGSSSGAKELATRGRESRFAASDAWSDDCAKLGDCVGDGGDDKSELNDRASVADSDESDGRKNGL